MPSRDGFHGRTLQVRPYERTLNCFVGDGFPVPLMNTAATALTPSLREVVLTKPKDGGREKFAVARCATDPLRERGRQVAAPTALYGFLRRERPQVPVRFGADVPWQIHSTPSHPRHPVRRGFALHV